MICSNCGRRVPSRGQCCPADLPIPRPNDHTPSPLSSQPGHRFGVFRVTRSGNGPLTSSAANSPKKRRSAAKNTRKQTTPAHQHPASPSFFGIGPSFSYPDPPPANATVVVSPVGPRLPGPPIAPITANAPITPGMVVSPMPHTPVIPVAPLLPAPIPRDLPCDLPRVSQNSAQPPSSRHREDIWRWLRPLTQEEKEAYEREMIVPASSPILMQRPKDIPWVACLFCE